MGPTGVTGLGGERIGSRRLTVFPERLDQILGAEHTHVEMPFPPLHILENVFKDCRFIRRIDQTQEQRESVAELRSLVVFLLVWVKEPSVKAYPDLLCQGF